MKDIAIVGAGGFARETACLIRKINEQSPTWNLIGFFDSSLAKGTRLEYGPVLGNDEDLNAYDRELAVAIAIGSPKIVKRLAENLTNKRLSFPNLISPDVTLYDEQRLSLGRGNIICAQCLISTNVSLGNFNILNCHVIVGHDAQLGDCNALMPSVNISGGVHIGNENYFGVAAAVLPGLHIGNRTKIGANSTIFQKTRDDQTYIGNPAYIFTY
ncbi:MAG: acetyltransferase [Succinivibrio sp.]|nr:acetyltransferase [Succinivibrio sp.]